MEEDEDTPCSSIKNQENNNEESYLTVGDRFMIDTKEEISSHMDKEEDNTIVGRTDEESSHLSIENQDTIEDQRDEESIVNSDIQEPTLPPPDESTYLTAYIPFRSSDSHDTSCSDLEGDNLVGISSLDRKHDCTEIESIDAFLQVDRCKWDASYYHFDDDPIYDTENDEHEIA
jgi:hypothetical protein